MTTSHIIVSLCHHPAWNLALEEYLIEQKKPAFYLWQNEPTVVIGRNQNPYKECNLDSIRRDGVHLVRRRSGGGTVYHDLGNLNFTIISQRNKNNKEENFLFVKKVLQTIGIDAQLSGRNDLEVYGKKISGSAFYETPSIFCHHGTLLVNVNLNKLQNYLTASKLKLQSKGIDSVKARVINLQQILPQITVDKIKNAFYSNFDSIPISVTKEQMQTNLAIFEKAKKYNSWDWTFGESVNYNISFEKRFNWGIVEANIFVDSGIIKSCKIFTDSIEFDNFDILSKSLLNKEFKQSVINDCINQTILNNSLKKDLSVLFNI